MSTAVANVTDAPRRSLLVDMATRYGMEPKTFADTLRATVVPRDATNEEFAAFLMVAKEYSLNPVLKEIYAFPKRGGGIQPIVSIDGWCNLINSHPQLNGIEFDDHIEGDKVTSITARIWRKDREKPIVVTEYLAECNRPTDPWKQYPRRMLRHKALIQCARYAFGFAGIVDPDEAERMGAAVPMRDITPRDEPPAPPMIEAAKVVQDAPTTAPTDEPAPPAQTAAAPEKAKDAAAPDPDKDPEAFRKWAHGVLAAVSDPEQLDPVFDENIRPFEKVMFPPDWEDIIALHRQHEQRLGID